MYNGSDAVEFSEQLQVLVSGWDDPVVIIRADLLATHQSVMTALDAAQRAGLFKLTFSMQKQP
jgi:biopolymer transport protein ExbD